MTPSLEDHETRIIKLEDKAGLLPPNVSHENRQYSTNFFQGQKGNSIEQGDELVIKVKGAESVSGILKDLKGYPIIIDQSHKFDEDNNAETINFKLKHRRFRLFNYNLPKGEYILTVKWWDKDTQREGGFTDKFAIV